MPNGANKVRVGNAKEDYVNFDQRNVHIWASRMANDREQTPVALLIAGDYMILLIMQSYIWLKPG